VSADPWLIWAARLNAFRVVPRALMLFYYGFFFRAWFYVVDWFMAFDWSTVDDQTVALAIAGFPAAILAVLTGVMSTLTKHYMQTGNTPPQE